MTLDISVLESSIRQRGLIDRLGDVGRFLTSFLRGGEVSEGKIRKAISELDTYFYVCSSQIDEVGAEKQKTYRHLQKLYAELDQADPATRAAVLAKLEIYLAKYKRYDTSLNRICENGKMSQALSEKLNELLYLRIGPMPRERIEQWATELALAIEAREEMKGVYEDLERVGKEASAPAVSEPSAVGEVDRLLDPSAVQAAESERERALREELKRILQ